MRSSFSSVCTPGFGRLGGDCGCFWGYWNCSVPGVWQGRTGMRAGVRSLRMFSGSWSPKKVYHKSEIESGFGSRRSATGSERIAICMVQRTMLRCKASVRIYRRGSISPDSSPPSMGMRFRRDSDDSVEPHPSSPRSSPKQSPCPQHQSMRGYSLS